MKLYNFQKRVLDETEEFNRVAYYLEMGLGKTFVGSEKLMSLYENRNNQRDLVICQKSKIGDWMNHFVANYPGEVVVYDLTNKKQWIDFWENPCGYRHQIGIINYELAWRRPALQELERYTLMLDESSLIQNHKAKQTKFILSLKPNNVILLSRTPVGGKYENLWS